MSYRRGGLGQAKWIPGQISFSTTQSGRLPDVQALRERGLPIAPYIEHGSWARGTPDIMRYGRDPYRGLGTDPTDLVNDAIRAGGETVQGSIQRTVEAVKTPAAVIGTGIVAGAAAGAVSGFFGKSLLGGLLGAVGGGIIGYGAWKLVLTPETRTA